MTKLNIDNLLAAMPGNTKTHEIAGISFEIHPLSFMKIAKLLRRYPQAMKVLFGQTENPIEAIIGFGPEAMAAVIANGVGYVDDLEAESKIAKLDDLVQLELLSVIVEATMPEGLDAFLGKFLPYLQKMGLVTVNKKGDLSIQADKKAKE